MLVDARRDEDAFERRIGIVGGRDALDPMAPAPFVAEDRPPVAVGGHDRNWLVFS
ncbi:MAG: hypothetical protein ACQET5_04745 [Halobacteriota archaeon]|uniref:hypothetical protein n=1 Tax=Natronomonas sp. TaxID=2184060 RepID=UPI0039759FFC